MSTFNGAKRSLVLAMVSAAAASLIFLIIPSAAFAAATSSVATVVVNTAGGTASSSAFSVSALGGTPSSFAGSAAGTPVTFAANTSFTISESSLANYTTSFAGTGCSGQTCAGSLAGGATSTYTITNTFHPPTINVIVTSDGGPNAISSFTETVMAPGATITPSASFAGSGTGTSVQIVMPSMSGQSFSIQETAVGNYTPSYSNGCSSATSQTLVAGAALTCTISNHYTAPVGPSEPTSTPSGSGGNNASSTNLILNPLLSATSSGLFVPDPSIIPADWQASDWGDAASASTTFTFPATDWAAAGGIGNGANVTIANYPNTGNGGDAKWAFQDVAVTAGAGYTFSDQYISNTSSILLAAFNDGTAGNDQLVVLPSSNGTLASATASFFVPANASSVTVYHLINGDGSLTTGNFSLELTTPVSQNLFPQGLISLTFDDGWQSQYDNALPILQAANLPASFYIITDTLANGSEPLFTNFTPENQEGVTENCDGTVGDFCAATSTAGATWSNVYTDPGGHDFMFSDTYSSTATSTVSVTYTPASSTATATQLIATLPSTGGASASTTQTFTLPTLAANTPINVLHQSAKGTTTITSASFAEIESGESDPTGYMTTPEILTMQADGEEIGAHTINHCDLAMLDADPNSATEGGDLGPPAGACASATSAPSTSEEQIDGSRAALLAAGLTPVDTFAYPYGGFDAGDETLLQQDGFIGARTSNPGYNYLTSDPLALDTEVIDASTTFEPNALQSVESLIDAAESNHAWLILLLHQVEPSSTITTNNDIDGTTPDFLQQITDYIKSKNDTVMTMQDVLTKYYGLTPPPIVPPTPTSTPPVAAPTISLSPASGTVLTAGTVSTSYSTSFSASSTNATDTFSWTITGLPSGLTSTSTSGDGGGTASATISGTPIATGTFPIFVKVNGANPSSTPASATYSLTINAATSTAPITPTSTPVSPTSTLPVITISTKTLPDGTVGLAYDQFIVATSTSASDTLNWSVASDTLPDGLGLNTSTGELFGTPGTQNALSFTVAVANASGTASSTQNYTLTIDAAATSTPTSTPPVAPSTPSPVPPANGSGSNSGGGSNGGSGGNDGGGGGAFVPVPQASTSTTGVVLGASTVNTFALLQSLMAQLMALEQKLVIMEFKQNGCPATFTKNLSEGMTDAQVENLQKVLDYTALTQVGDGSPNDESTYFGNTTKNAVIMFQNIFATEILAPNGLAAGNGYVGASTRNELNELCSQ